jgi:lipoteichoic acid synthase
MKKMNQVHLYYGFLGIFFLSNILNTYFLTVSHLNRYIAPFKHTFLGTVNAFFGNFAILLMCVLIVFSLIKNLKNRMIALVVLSFILNFFVYIFGLFNLFFGTAFSKSAFIIFKNPAPGIASGIILEMLNELFTYYRIFVFLPFFILLALLIFSNRAVLKTIAFPYKLKLFMSGILITILILFVSILSYGRQFSNTVPIQSAKSTYAIQNLGVYPYYVGQLLGYKFNINTKAILNIKTDEDLALAYQEYNKNQSEYTNFFNGLTYSNRLTPDQTIDSLNIHPSLIKDGSLHGILEDRDIVLIHLESFNYFLLEIAETKERLPFLQNLLEQSFVFSQFYNNVGMGVSSDAEFSVLTGLYPTGDETIFWEYENRPYAFNSLVKYFNQLEYYTKAIHGDTEIFYNRRQVYDGMFEFNEFYALEDFINDGYDVSSGYMYDTVNQRVHHSPWISDFHLADMVYEVGKSFQNTNQRFMLFPVAMMPHTPFDYDPNGLRTDVYPQWVNEISPITLKYINYVDYYDDSIKRFFLDEFNQSQTLDNTVYIFYSDHGAGLKNGDLDILYGYELDPMENRKKLQETIAFIYVPGENNINYGSYSIKEGLITGQQNLVRSQVDLYRTIIELFNLPVGEASYFGVHGFSHEPTFALDNRISDVVTDTYFYSMRNPNHIYPANANLDPEIYQYILRFKMLSDLLLTKPDFQAMIDDAIAKLN